MCSYSLVGVVLREKWKYQFIDRSRAHGVDEVDSQLEDEYYEE